MKLIISGTEKISGAEYVLKDYIDNTEIKKEFIICTTDSTNAKIFYEKLELNKLYYLKSLNPVGAGENGGLNSKLKKVGKYFGTFNELIKIKKENPNIKLIIGNNTIESIYSVLVKLVFKKKFVLYVHDIVKKDNMYGKLIRAFGIFIDKYIVVSNATMNGLLNVGVKINKIELIYNGLKYKGIEKKNYNKNDLKIGFVGTINERKNPMLYLKLLKGFKENQITIKGYLVYNYADEEIKEKLVKYIKENKLDVDLIDNIERSKMDDFYQTLDYLAVTSNNDPFPTVVLESMNNGVPVLGRNIDGIPEMVSDGINGILFSDENDIQKMVRKIIEINKDEYLKMSKKANQIIEIKFNIQNKVKKLDLIIEREGI